MFLIHKNQVTELDISGSPSFQKDLEIKQVTEVLQISQFLSVVLKK